MKVLVVWYWSQSYIFDHIFLAYYWIWPASWAQGEVQPRLLMLQCVWFTRIPCLKLHLGEKQRLQPLFVRPIFMFKCLCGFTITCMWFCGRLLVTWVGRGNLHLKIELCMVSTLIVWPPTSYAACKIVRLEDETGLLKLSWVELSWSRDFSTLRTREILFRLPRGTPYTINACIVYHKLDFFLRYIST